MWPLLVGRALLLELLSLSFGDETVERAKVLVGEVLLPLPPLRDAEQYSVLVVEEEELVAELVSKEVSLSPENSFLVAEQTSTADTAVLMNLRSYPSSQFPMSRRLAPLSS